MKRAVCILLLALAATPPRATDAAPAIDLVWLGASIEFSEMESLYIDIDAGLWAAGTTPGALAGLWDIRFSRTNDTQTLVQGGSAGSGGDSDIYEFACDTDSDQIQALGTGVGVDDTLPDTTFQTQAYLDTTTNWPVPTHAFIGFRRDATGGSYNYGFLEAQQGSLTIVGFGFQSTATDWAATTEPIPIPEPALAGLAFAGLLGLAVRARTRPARRSCLPKR